MTTREQSSDAFVGVDIGGTHTDVTVVLGDRVVRGKALTTYHDFSEGLLEAVGVAADNLGISRDELLGRCRLLVNGTTVVTNAITQMKGSRVGILVTAGFKDTFRFGGGPRNSSFDDHLQVNIPDLVERRAIAEVEGRIDHAGRVLVPLNEAQLEAAARGLVEDVGVEAMAVGFLWSAANPEHELRAREIVQSLYPDIFVSLSHELFRVRGENRRWTTAALNSFVQRSASTYLTTVSTKLHEGGLTGSLAFFSGLGGVVSRTRAERVPLSLLGSGPAAGAIGANELALRMGRPHILVGDMGGTSFDTGIIRDNTIQVASNVEIGPFETGLNLVEVISVGAGGGSIAWISDRGVPQVGPQSAGSNPGPACYDRGGDQPTVTDAMVTLGVIDPDNYLGGRLRLEKKLAIEALERHIAQPFGWSPERAAAAIHDLVVASMANAIREVSVSKGYDPADFLFLAYGGTMGLFASQIASAVGIDEVLLPANSSVFCASGVLTADYTLRYDSSVTWDLENPEHLGAVNDVLASMLATARDDMRMEGFSDDAISTVATGDFKFLSQVFELAVPLPTRPITPEDLASIREAFVELYERTYGQGTAWTGVPVHGTTIAVTVCGRRSRPPAPTFAPDPVAPERMEKAARSIFVPSTQVYETVPIYDDQLFTVGSRIVGPAIIDAIDTTIYVPPTVSAERDEWMNYVLTNGGGA